MKPQSLNYLYFGALFSMLIVLSAGSIFSHQDLGGSQFFFLFYSLGQALLEIMLFLLGGWLIQRYLRPFWFTLYIGITFLCLLFHILDFVLHRIMNYTLLETLSFLSDETFENFLQMLDASGIPFWGWALIFGCVAMIPLFGILIYFITNYVTKKRPFGFRLEFMLQALFCLPIALVLWDFSGAPLLHREAHYTFVRSLPWKMTFLHPHVPVLYLRNPLPLPMEEGEQLKQLSTVDEIPAKRPNVYLFIAESLRKDFINQEVAPNLTAFREANIHSNLSLANANATPISWFSIFYSKFPYYWQILSKKGWKTGSPALQLLRKIGYQIHVYTAANLSYYNMDTIILGENRYLADSFVHVPHQTIPAWKSDQAVVQAFLKDERRNQEGQCFVFFLDSTHFNYSWPSDETVFTPIATEMNYFQAYHSKDAVELIKNRYRNAVHFLDKMFAQCIEGIPDRENQIIVFSADHAEEFFDRGHLFHLSQLSDAQTEIPLFLQLPKRPETLSFPLVQMDIFPTIFDVLLTKPLPERFFQGQSLFAANRWPYAVMARYNAGRDPLEFCLHNGKHKLIARFFKTNSLLDTKGFKILSLRTHDDQLLEDYKKDLTHWIHQEFGAGFERLLEE